jgi:hypothetical protein
LLRLRNPDDDFAGLCVLQLFAGDFLDRVRIGLQRFHLLAELHIFRIQAVDLFPHFFDFVLRPAHGDKSVRAENIVNQQRQDEQAENGAAMLREKRGKASAAVHAFL